jgi:phosphoglycerate dehydrogenase-like enzyme
MAPDAERPIVVTLPETLRTGFREAVEAVSPRIRVVLVPAEGAVPAEISDAAVFYRSYALQRDVVDAVLERATRLRWMHVPAAGIEAALTPRVMAADFTITNVSGVYDVPVAEHALALILAAAKRLPAYFAAQRDGRWLRAATWDAVQEEPVLPVLLRGKTAAIIGFGGIGGTLGGYLKALGMRVLGVRREPRPDPRADAMYGPDQLCDVIPEADFIVLSVPMTAATERMIGAEQIARMKPSTWLINLGRGRLVDDAALLAALEGRRIGGAGLDVFTQEPLPSDSSYYRLPNVIVTPHIAGAFPDLNELDRETFVANLRRYVAGEPLTSVVDRARGY